MVVHAIEREVLGWNRLLGKQERHSLCGAEMKVANKYWSGRNSASYPEMVPLRARRVDCVFRAGAWRIGDSGVEHQ